MFIFGRPISHWFKKPKQLFNKAKEYKYHILGAIIVIGILSAIF
jgi:hypothetical protein